MKKKTRTATRRTVPAATLDAMHDAGTDLSAHMDMAKPRGLDEPCNE
jgi:hypothetical protein